jgi:hypothetical protein
MNTCGVPSDSPKEASELRYSLNDVLTAERPAWAEHEGVAFHFDGICIWEQREGRWSSPTSDTVPQVGWWHRGSCNCPLCRPTRE